MKALIETSAINWLADSPAEAEEFFAHRDAGRLRAIVTPEVAKEIRDTKDPDRLKQLEAVLSRFFPLTGTRIPRLGPNTRMGLAYIAMPRAKETNRSLGFLRDGPDRTHLVNASEHRCDVFVTRDDELWRKKVREIEGRLVTVRVIHPLALLEELRRG